MLLPDYKTKPNNNNILAEWLSAFDKIFLKMGCSLSQAPLAS